jgi:ribosome maturation factor RimP
METEGTAKIAQAVALCQVNPDDVKIEWTSGRIIVTVSSGAVYLSSDDVLSEDDQELLRKSEEQYGPIDDVVVAEEVEDEDLVSSAASASAAAQPPEDEDGTSNSSTAETADDPTIAATVVAASGGVDIAALARAINQAFQGSVIAELYEIEVTTPGASDELSGIMWQAYRGFDVIATYTHPKTNQVQTLEGRLIERTADHTILNLKGRLKKLDNGTVQSVKLPPAKKEPLSL